MPIAYIPRTRERYADYPPYRWVVNDEAPWTPLARPLAECRLALVSSGGFYLKDQPPFEDNDASYRAIPKATDLRDLRIHHHGYRDDDADRDPNCVFPLERLRELEAAGVLGQLAEHAISFVTLYSWRREVEERAPRIVRELQRMAVDAAFLVPV
jgi:D-proline reductase (dithiol) PrdB